MLVETSVWIDFFNDRDFSAIAKYCPLVLVEMEK
jgi:hypothetical protein